MREEGERGKGMEATYRERKSKVTAQLTTPDSVLVFRLNLTFGKSAPPDFGQREGRMERGGGERGHN